MTGFLDTETPLPYCAGCGHPHVLRALDEALTSTELPAERFVLVTDIGCVGLADAYFPTLHTVHTLHGRAAAIAAGLGLAARPSDTDPLKPVVMVGDGGATIGLLHLVHGAQLDVDVTILVHNNLIYGMTGGQHSGLTPQGLRTTTTPDGCPIAPLDLGRILTGAGCGFFARARAPGDELAGALEEAIRHPGFACVEALELCPTFAARVGGMTGKGLNALAEELGLPMGIVHRREPEPAAATPPPTTVDPDPLASALETEPAWRRLEGTARVVIAGRAGERVQSAARLAASAAAAAGLEVSVRTDNPVTQGRGFSLAELTMSPRRIDYTGLVDPDLVLVTAPEGLQALRLRGLFTSTVAEDRTTGRVVIDESITPPDPATCACDSVGLRRRFGAKGAALGGLVEEVDRAGWWDPAAWEVAVQRLPASQQRETRKVMSLARDSATA